MRGRQEHRWIHTLALWLVPAVMLSGAGGAAAGPEASGTHWRIVPPSEATERVYSRMLHLPAGEFDPRVGMLEIPRELRLQESEKWRPGVPWIVQFRRTPGQAERDALEARGFSVHTYVPDNSWLVRGTDMAGLAELPGAIWAGPLHPGYRMTPDLLMELDAAGEPRRMRLLLLELAERGRVTAALSAAGAALSEVMLPHDDTRIYFSGGPEVARAAARLDGVRRVELVRTDFKPLNDESRPVIQSGSVDGGEPYHQSGLTGAGQVVGLMDEGLNLDTLLLADTDSQAGSAGPVHRKIYGYSPNWGDFETCACPAAGGFSHGTMAAQAIAGQEPNPQGGTFGPQAGIAPDSKIFFQDAKVAGGMSCSDPQNDDLNLPMPLNLAFAEFSYAVPVSTCEAGGVCSGDNSVSCATDQDCALNDRQGLLWVGPFGSATGGYCPNAGDADEQLWNYRDFMLFFPAGNEAEDVQCPATAKNVISAGGHYQYPHLDIYGAVSGASLVCSVTDNFCTTDADCAADSCEDGLCSLSGGTCFDDLDCATDICAGGECYMTGATCIDDSDCPLNPCIDPTMICEGTSISCTSDAHCDPGISCVGPDAELSCLLFGGSCTTDADCTADLCEESTCVISGGPCASQADCVQDFCGESASRRIQPMLLAPACDLPGNDNLSISGQQSDSCINEPTDMPSNSVYEGTCGTSYASAYLAGAAALVRDYYRQGFHEGCADSTATTCGQPNAAAGLSPSGALVKATLLNSGEYIAPDDCPDCGGILGGQGLGRVNLSRTLPLSSYPETPGSIYLFDSIQEGSIAPGLPDGYRLGSTYYVGDASQELRATLVWMDRGAFGDTLHNQLRVRLEGPTETYYGNNFGGYCSVTTGACARDADCTAAGETCLASRETTLPVSAGGMLNDTHNTFSTIRIAPEDLVVGTWELWVDGLSVPLPDDNYICPASACGFDLPTLPFALVMTGGGFEISSSSDDADSDGEPNFGDNCPNVANGPLEDFQADDDSDGVGNACDNCGLLSNSNQLDSDDDAVGDACDNCPFTPIPGQEDNDSDGLGNSCDCAPDDITTWEPVTRVTGVRLNKVAGSTELSWSGLSGTGIGAPVYDVLRSSTPSFESGSICVEPDGADTTASDPGGLAAGEIAFYVVRPENSCGPGSLGTTSEGVERVLLSGGCGP